MNSPLADRLRPESLDDMVGQSHLLAQGKALRNIIESGDIPNLIFYGPSGVGKTTLASIIAKQTNKRLYKLNATNASISDIRDIIDDVGTLMTQNGILLYLDEIQYFNKKQQQSLLEYLESGEITMIASTTENPYFYVYNAVISRSTVFEFKSIAPEEIVPAVNRAFKILEKDNNVKYEFEDGAQLAIARAAGGDVRKAINTVELLGLATLGNADINKEKATLISLETITEVTGHTAMRYDRAGDDHYDIVSAYQKSLRGSDPDAALHYLARLLEAGDLPSAVRRLLVCACEDVGLAYPQIIPIVKSACDIALQVGLPEAQIPLADAVILVATSPKSNSGEAAIMAAMADVQSGNTGAIPRTLQNKHFDGEDQTNPGQFYKYPHDYENHWIPQQYLPDAIKDKRYYEYGNNKIEQANKAYWDKIKG
ncbi:MAG: replication-associated recombination protein A [Oscillospiraceae bacterium]|nr:replication-associated recombination protein A [Candidatus Limimonas coprohippi]MCQ2487844.1 replication-associated recombination protein A [Clostridia bacterium]